MPVAYLLFLTNIALSLIFYTECVDLYSKEKKKARGKEYLEAQKSEWK